MRYGGGAGGGRGEGRMWVVMKYRRVAKGQRGERKGKKKKGRREKGRRERRKKRRGEKENVE